MTSSGHKTSAVVQGSRKGWSPGFQEPTREVSPHADTHPLPHTCSQGSRGCFPLPDPISARTSPGHSSIRAPIPPGPGGAGCPPWGTMLLRSPQTQPRPATAEVPVRVVGRLFPLQQMLCLSTTCALTYPTPVFLCSFSLTSLFPPLNPCLPLLIRPAPKSLVRVAKLFLKFQSKQLKDINGIGGSRTCTSLFAVQMVLPLSVAMWAGHFFTSHKLQMLGG